MEPGDSIIEEDTEEDLEQGGSGNDGFLE